MTPSNTAAFGSGAVIGALGGLIGLDSAEFRPPSLNQSIPLPRPGLGAGILNKVISRMIFDAVSTIC
jgi:hypothetical protein